MDPPHLALPRVAAHRGANRLAPENTLAAFSAAIEAGARAIELDVHLSRDKKPVVIHDAELDRTTDGHGPVSSASAPDELATAAVATLRRRGATDRTLLMSFDVDAALAAKRVGPELRVGPILPEAAEDPLELVLTRGLDGLNQAADRFEGDLIAAFHHRGLLVHGSLINDPAALAAFFERGGDLADSDEPACYASASNGGSMSAIKRMP